MNVVILVLKIIVVVFYGSLGLFKKFKLFYLVRVLKIVINELKNYLNKSFDFLKELAR